ncbi:MAG: hypothetical protein IKO49_00070 [Bacilli bacterium]|nr:hypothetical protein [Bacilli bacterium]
MKKTVSFTKNLEFPTMIGEITEITLEDNLKFVDSNNIEGSFFIGGKYKMTGASLLEEDFSFNLPIEVAVVENLDINTCKVSVSDFTYEVVDDSVLKVNVEIFIEGMEIIEDDKDDLEEVDVERECDGDSKDEKELEVPIKQEVKKEDENNNQRDHSVVFDQEQKTITDIDLPKSDYIDNEINNTNSLFSNLADEDDSFSTYSIYIMRDGDSIEKVMEKYNVTKEMLEEYNDLKSISINSKVIIPASIDE